MISISAQRKRRPAGARNAPTPERLAKADAPEKYSPRRYRVPDEKAASAEPPSTNDPLKHWRARGVISDTHYAAGRQFQKLFEKAQIGGSESTARDRPARQSVSTSATPGSLLARSELDALKPLLGALDYRLLCSVLGEGRDIEKEAPEAGEHGKAYVGRRIRDALNVLAMRG